MPVSSRSPMRALPSSHERICTVFVKFFATHLAFIMPLALLGVDLARAEVTLPRSASPDGASVYIISPADGAVVKNPVTIQFGLQGMSVAPAGVAREGAGHHHLIVDAPLPDLSSPIPSDTQHLHFGGGQTETSLELTPGEHTLQLVMGDAIHLPHEPPVVSAQISITVIDLAVKLEQREQSIRYELIVDIPIRMGFDGNYLEDNPGDRRARIEKEARNDKLLELLAEEIGMAQ